MGFMDQGRISRRNHNEKSNMGGWSTPSAVGSASEGGWRSFQPVSHDSIDAGESSTPIEERGVTRGGERGMGIDVERGVRSNGQRGVERGVGSSIECGMEHEGMMMCEVNQTWESTVVANKQLAKQMEGAKVGGMHP